MLPGWGLKQFLGARGIRWSTDSASQFLSTFALGVHVNALIFIACWTFANPSHPLHIALTIVVLDILIGLIGLRWSKPFPRTLDGYLVGFGLIGITLGIFAALRFPSTLDSVQILELQQFMLGWNGGVANFPGIIAQLEHLLFGGLAIPLQPGFGGIALVPALLQGSLPVATVASANKVLLFALAAVISVYVCRQFSFKHAIVCTTLILGNLVLSQFGLNGMFSTGKDSIFAVLMALASIASLVSEERDANEPGLFMSAAILLGAVAVPYLAVFWVLYFMFSGGAILPRVTRQAKWCLYPLVISVVGVHAVFAKPGSHPIGLLPALIAGIMAIGAMSVISRKLEGRSVHVGELTRIALACLPALCVIGIVYVMPVTGHIITGYVDGVSMTAAYPPLDGKTTAAGFLWQMYPTNNPALSITAILGLALAPLLARRLRTPFFLALFCFLPATALFALMNVRLGIHILPDFNLWDISRDTVQWYMGAFGAVFCVLGIGSLLNRFPGWQVITVPAAFIVFLAGLSQNYPNHTWVLSQKPTITASGGFIDPVVATAMDDIWRNARGGVVYVSANSPFDTYFYHYQMYGAKSVTHFDARLVGTEKRQTFLANAADLRSILLAANSRRESGSVRVLNENAYIVSLTDDHAGVFDSGGIPHTFLDVTGAYAPETSNGVRFRWASQTVTIKAIRMTGTDPQYCPTLKFVNTWGDTDMQIQVINGSAHEAVLVPKAATFTEPASISTCVNFDADGTAVIRLISSHAARQFPNNDTRSVSFGLIWPIQQ